MGLIARLDAAIRSLPVPRDVAAIVLPLLVHHNPFEYDPQAQGRWISGWHYQNHQPWGNNLIGMFDEIPVFRCEDLKAHGLVLCKGALHASVHPPDAIDFVEVRVGKEYDGGPLPTDEETRSAMLHVEITVAWLLHLRCQPDLGRCIDLREFSLEAALPPEGNTP